MWFDDLLIAWSILKGQKLRSTLTMGSIAIGAFSIVIMSSLAESGLASLNAGLEAIGGARMLALWDRYDLDGSPHRVSYSDRLSRYDITLLRSRSYIKGLTHVAQLSSKDLISDTGRTLQVDLVATDADFFGFFQ